MTFDETKKTHRHDIFPFFYITGYSDFSWDFFSCLLFSFSLFPFFLSAGLLFQGLIHSTNSLMITSNPLQPTLPKSQLIQPLLNPQLSPSNHFEKRSRTVQYLVPAPGSTSWWSTSRSTFCCFLAFSSPRLRQCLSRGHHPQQHIIEHLSYHTSLSIF